MTTRVQVDAHAGWPVQVQSIDTGPEGEIVKADLGIVPAYSQPFPKWGERQKIMRRIYPPAPRVVPAMLTDEERDYLIERLAEANDEVGQGLLRKLVSTPLIGYRG